MEKLKRFWYRIVAGGLVSECKTYVETLEKSYLELQKRRNMYSLLEKQNYNLRRRIEILERTDPLGRSIDVASAHASRMRIRDLEAQLRRNKIEPQ